MTSFLKWARTAMNRDPWPVLRFPTSGFEVIKPSHILDEERFEEFEKGRYYPVNIGDVLVSKYQVVGKLGFGTTSTVWLARDFGEDLLKSGLKQIFLALDYLHSECQLVHTDIKGDNILQELEEMSILDRFTDSEIEHPSARKSVDNMPVYASRRFELPQNFGRAVLSDFGSAVRGDEERNHDAQPTIYRSPEVMLKIQWSYPIDIWNVGTMIWDLFEGKHMFIGMDPDGKGYSTRAHLAEVIGILGPPPSHFLKRGERSHEFFTKDGHWNNQVDVPGGLALEISEERLSGRNKEMFLEFMGGMLQWQPEDRKTAKQLLKDPWLENRA
ncbi:hypothetical protein N7517_002188 [Penicillium concentricum]|uniref:non-specific serine/threonine protein kinase n=1 Tax=Penicillium concentricum TaxID=293559 RepID=A0A9W9STJ8_9EURO|nr:uncharacterized protein N7517_002188 [Penicillium concentricum]KAJ5384277.1 hypothetical protein N7517_002188 [Penicillium concentricum]